MKKINRSSNKKVPVWQKKNNINIDENIMKFMADDDVLLDASLIQFDIQASIAHVNGLASINLLTQLESISLIEQLNALSIEIKQSKFILSQEFEDCHSAIEFYLVDKLGDLGKKVHTGRSRNDQILVASRLYLKQSLEQSIDQVKASVKACLSQAKATQQMVMPGYTHLQRAVPSSVGLWFAGFAEAMIDNLISLKASLHLIDANPLGTAAGYGVNLPLNRQLTTEELNFSRIQINPIYTQNSRGKFELAVLNTLSLCLLDTRRYCWDISLFTTEEFDFVELPDEMTTGSSIMPNKRNPDLIELMRAGYATVQAATVELQSLLSLPSGYQRDLQLTKAPMLRGITKALQILSLFPQLVLATKFKTNKLTAAINTPMYATDFAMELSAQGLPFRDAYQEVVNRYVELANRTPIQSINERVSPGACADLMLSEMEKRFEGEVGK